LVVGFTSVLSERVYPYVPEARGGGSPVTVKLFLNADGSKFWKRLGALVCSCSDGDFVTTGEVSLMYQNDHEIVVMAYREDPKKKGPPWLPQLVTVSKSLVDGIQMAYTPTQFDFQQ
jgi:hypothetical protein